MTNNSTNTVLRQCGWKSASVITAGVFCGAVVWWLSVPFTGTREPFDSSSVYYPAAMFVSGLIAALPAPARWWLAPPAVFLGERVYQVLFMPEERAWLLFGIVINAWMLTWLPTAVGAALVYGLHRWLAKPSRSGPTSHQPEQH